MNIREEIVAKVQSLPENVLPEVFDLVNKLEKNEEKPSLMSQLRKIKIQAPPDFAENIDLYMNGEKSMEENIR